VRGLVAPDAAEPPGDAVTVYPVIGLPPSNEGAVNDTDDEAFPTDADPMTGGSGTGEGVTALEAADSTLLPTALVACTVKLYGVPFDRPLTVMGLVVPLAVIPPGDAVTV
jgi:hypothetical protein